MTARRVAQIGEGYVQERGSAQTLVKQRNIQPTLIFDHCMLRIAAAELRETKVELARGLKTVDRQGIFENLDRLLVLIQLVVAPSAHLERSQAIHVRALRRLAYEPSELLAGAPALTEQ